MPWKGQVRGEAHGISLTETWFWFPRKYGKDWVGELGIGCGGDDEEEEVEGENREVEEVGEGERKGVIGME